MHVDPDGENPFGRWTKYRATIAALNRSDASNATLEAESRQLLIAARLADKIIECRNELTAPQRAELAALLS